MNHHIVTQLFCPNYKTKFLFSKSLSSNRTSENEKVMMNQQFRSSPKTLQFLPFVLFQSRRAREKNTRDDWITVPPKWAVRTVARRPRWCSCVPASSASAFRWVFEKIAFARLISVVGWGARGGVLKNCDIFSVSCVFRRSINYDHLLHFSGTFSGAILVTLCWWS